MVRSHFISLKHSGILKMPLLPHRFTRPTYNKQIVYKHKQIAGLMALWQISSPPSFQLSGR